MISKSWRWIAVIILSVIIGHRMIQNPEVINIALASIMLGVIATQLENEIRQRNRKSRPSL